MDLRSPLAKVKGLGAAKSGTHHWIIQRLTAVALVPLIIWFVLLVIKASVNAEQLLDYMHKPLNAVAMILFIAVSLYHGYLGMKVIVEDYVHCNCAKISLIVLLNFVTTITAVAAVLSIIYLHIGKQHYSDNKMENTAENRKWEQEFHNKLKAAIGQE